MSSFVDSAEIQKKIEQQRTAMDIELLMDNYMNKSNLDIFAICEQDLNRSTPTKEYRCDDFRRRIKSLRQSRRK